MDGVEVCRQIRDFSEVPVLFLSGFEDRERIHQALAWGDGYLLKPFSLHLII
jgi:DNA-binding response OmpR family regulator